MGETTGISWTHHTFNPWWGCEKPLVQIGGKLEVSPECVSCYAEVWDARWDGRHWGRTAPRRFFGDKHWAEPLKWNRDALKAGERRRVFCLSMGDILEDRPDLDEHRSRLWDLIRETQALDWMLLTKRYDRFDSVPDWVWQLPNVWPGVSAGTQEMADLRIPYVLRLKDRFPHLIAWASLEPMTGPVDLTKIEFRYSTWYSALEDHDGFGLLGACHRKLDLAIIGGESQQGKKQPRPFHLEWGLDLIKQCHEHNTAAFMKQVGSAPFLDGKPLPCKDRSGANPEEWPLDLRVRQMPEVKRLREALGAQPCTCRGYGAAPEGEPAEMTIVPCPRCIALGERKPEAKP